MLQVLEKCFVDDYDGERIKGIIKETILRADQTLLQARKQSLNLFNVSNEEVKRDVDKFFKEFMRSKGFFWEEGGVGLGSVKSPKNNKSLFFTGNNYYR